MERNEHDAVFDVLGLDEKPRASRLLWAIDGSSAWPMDEDLNGSALPNRRWFAFFWAAVQRPAPRVSCFFFFGVFSGAGFKCHTNVLSTAPGPRQMPAQVALGAPGAAGVPGS